jgi:hypothetical protein
MPAPDSPSLKYTSTFAYTQRTDCTIFFTRYLMARGKSIPQRSPQPLQNIIDILGDKDADLSPREEMRKVRDTLPNAPSRKKSQGTGQKLIRASCMPTPQQLSVKNRKQNC